MMNHFNGFDQQIWANGKDIGILWGNDAYIIENVLVKSMNVSIGMIDVASEHGWKEAIPGQNSVDLQIEGGQINVIDGDKLLLNLDLFHDFRIRDLFREINKKIDKR